MLNLYSRSKASSAPGGRSKRRPAGISRRQKKQFGFESLEDRRVMTTSPLVNMPTDIIGDLQITSFSSRTPAGQLATLQNELYWQSLIEQSSEHVHAQTFSIPTDPLVGSQWHLINSGQQVGNPDYQDIFAVAGEDINVAPAWNRGYTGNGVTVAVVDSGVELLHPDLVNNIDPALQLDALDRDGDANPEIFPFDPNFPFLYNPTNAHGTAVAGLIASEAFNGIGGTGVAHEAQIVPVRLIDAGQFEQAFVDTFRYETDQIDVTNNSWGPGVVRGVSGPSAAELLAIRDSIFFGRDGKGVIHMFASGNSGEAADSSSYNGWVNSRYTIGVTGVDHDGFYNNIDGTTTGYPETGASVLVAAPTGSVALGIVDDTGIGSGIVTADTTGNSGFNIDPDPDTGQEFDRDFLLDDHYTTRFNGTSAATPIATGVVALMLEANPNLHWRDVQEILLRSARQNAKFEVAGNGLDRGFGFVGPLNTWVVNGNAVFHDPDSFDPAIDPLVQVATPTLDPNLTSFANNAVHYQPIVHTLTNGAGYTISQGLGAGGNMLGYAHGVVDADVAVSLAEQWHTKGQALPDELTFTTAVNAPFDDDIPAAEVLNVDGTNLLLVPGGLFGDAGFIKYWQEYFEDEPFVDFTNDLERGLPLEMFVPDDNAMVVENLEVRVNISGGDTEALDHLRITVVSPNGTHSELNHFTVDPSFNNVPLQVEQAGLNSNFVIGDPGSVGTGGNLTWTFTTNRNWGERSDPAIMFDPRTQEPIQSQFFGGPQFFPTSNEADPGTAFTQGWQLHLENYGDTALNLENFEIAWHGRPINPLTKRVQGLIGVDDNQDDLFNYSRVDVFDFDANNVTRLGEVISTVDDTHESMGANVTVTATRVSDGIIVDQFVTGNDGNFYFDLLPDDYIISIDDPLGRTALDDSLSNAGFVKNYQSEWHITEDWFHVWDYDANLEVPIDPATGAPTALIDNGGSPIEYHVSNINFLLDPGVVPPDQVEFTGVVFADTNGDGGYNSDDVFMPNISVFGDMNRNGAFDSGEPLANTAGDGSYTLNVPATVAGIINVGVLPPLQWNVTNPVGGIDTFFANPGERISNVDFAIEPVANAGDGGAGPGIILGTVFNDPNANARRDAGEVGVEGMQVYLDLNRSGALDAGDRVATTNEHGSYVFTQVAAGNYQVRIDAPLPFQQTLPFLGGANVVNLGGAGTAFPVNFGVENTAVLDFGDLPSRYAATLLAEDGARHSKGAFFLGARIDTELNGQPTADADGDDLAGAADEDGIVMGALPAGGGTVSLTATASRHGGFLKAWIDFNDNGSFDDPGERIVFRDPADPGAPASDNWLLDAGANTLEFDAPAVSSSTVYARFRYGEFDIDSITGFAQIGEVEDYALPVDSPLVAPSAGEPGDFNNDDRVHGSDFLAWQRGVGANGGVTVLDGDGNGDGNVDAIDLGAWQAGFTAGPATVAAPLTGDYDLNGKTVGSDFLAWQRGVDQTDPNLDQGDGNGDNAVDGDDLVVWEGMFGTGVFASLPSGQGAVAFSGSAAPNQSTSTGNLADLGQRVAAELGSQRAIRHDAADAVFEEQHDDQVLPARSTATRLPRAAAVNEADIATVSRARTEADAENDRAERDAAFASLPRAFYR